MAVVAQILVLQLTFNRVRLQLFHFSLHWKGCIVYTVPLDLGVGRVHAGVGRVHAGVRHVDVEGRCRHDPRRRENLQTWHEVRKTNLCVSIIRS